GCIWIGDDKIFNNADDVQIDPRRIGEERPYRMIETHGPDGSLVEQDCLAVGRMSEQIDVTAFYQVSTRRFYEVGVGLKLRKVQTLIRRGAARPGIARRFAPHTRHGREGFG